jgi:hypothetical protein
MKLRPVLADTGRPTGSALNLLNAGWTATSAAPLADGGWTIPEQTLAVFVEVSPNQLNQPVTLLIELVDDDGNHAHFMPGPQAGGPEARLEHQVVATPVPGAPNGIPGTATVCLGMPAGTLWIPAPRQRYTWRISAESVTEEIGFWVLAPPQNVQNAADGSGGVEQVN